MGGFGRGEKGEDLVRRENSGPRVEISNCIRRPLLAQVLRHGSAHNPTTASPPKPRPSPCSLANQPNPTPFVCHPLQTPARQARIRQRQGCCSPGPANASPWRPISSSLASRTAPAPRPQASAVHRHVVVGMTASRTDCVHASHSWEAVAWAWKGTSQATPQHGSHGSPHRTQAQHQPPPSTPSPLPCRPGTRRLRGCPHASRPGWPAPRRGCPRWRVWRATCCPSFLCLPPAGKRTNLWRAAPCSAAPRLWCGIARLWAACRWLGASGVRLGES